MNDDDPAHTRQQLVVAATVEFENRGYTGAAVEYIAERAGVSVDTFYTHFTGKTELAEGLWDVARVTLIGLYRELGRRPQRDIDTLRGWLRKTFTYYERNRRRLLAVHEAIALEPDLSEMYFEHTEEIVDLLVPLARDRTEDVVRTRMALLSIQHERFCFLSILRGLPFDRDAAMNALAQSWFHEIGTV